MQTHFESYLHVKNSISGGTTFHFPRTITHINVVQISPCKTLLKEKTYITIGPRSFFINIPLWKCFAWKNPRTFYMWTCNFQSVLHADAQTWADTGSLKVKYLVNAVIFIHKLLSNSLIFLKNFECRPIP